jgi:hypothetical protein
MYHVFATGCSHHMSYPGAHPCEGKTGLSGTEKPRPRCRSGSPATVNPAASGQGAKLDPPEHIQLQPIPDPSPPPGPSGRTVANTSYSWPVWLIADHPAAHLMA